MTLLSHHNDVITIKILSFSPISPIKEQKFRDVTGLKKETSERYKIKENFLSNINNSILMKLSITKRILSAKIQCANVTLAGKLNFTISLKFFLFNDIFVTKTVLVLLLRNTYDFTSHVQH